MTRTFVSEPLLPDESGFDADAMARGEPGLPPAFTWRERKFHIAAVLGRSKAYGDCAHGSGERYVRRHAYRLRMLEGPIWEVYFQRSFGRGRFRKKGRWMLQSTE